MVFGAELHIPNILLLVMHVIGLVLGAWLANFAWKKWAGSMKNLAYFFCAFAVSEFLYVTAHAGWIAISFAHQVGQSLLWLGIIVAVFSLIRKKQ